MISPSLKNELIEIIALGFHTKEIDEVGSLLYSSYNSNKISGTAAHISISSRKSAKALVEYSELNNNISQLIKLIVELDGGIILGRHIRIEGIEIFLNQLAREGLVYDFHKRKLLRKDKDVEEMLNWGSLKNGRIYDATIMSLDIAGNSILVRKYGIKKMENVYFKLWNFLKVRLKEYDGRIWSWAGDGGILAFVFKNHQERGTMCGLEIQSLMSIFNLRVDFSGPERINLRIALDTGKLKFYNDTGKIVSEVINYAAHLEKKGTEPGKVAISGKLHDSLTRNISDLFRPAGIFEDKDYFSTPLRLDNILSLSEIETDRIKNFA